MTDHPCLTWAKRTRRQIRNAQWDQLDPCPCKAPCVYTTNHIICWLATYSAPFSPPLIERLSVLFPDSLTEWRNACVETFPTLAFFRYLVEHLHVDVNQDPPLIHPSLPYPQIHQRMDAFEYLLSQGANVNLPNHQRNTVLHIYLTNAAATDLMSNHFPPDTIQLDQFYDRLYHTLQVMLDHGADPLLPDQHGMTPLRFLQTRRLGASVTQHQRLLSLLERYASF